MWNFLIIFAASYLYIFICAIAVIYFLAQNKAKKRSLILLTVFSFPISFVFAKISSFLIYNPRPFVIEHIKPLIQHSVDNGFPSDHTLLAMTVAMVMFRFNKKLGTILSILALFVGLARVFAHVHHLVDIFGGMAIAVGAVYISSYLIKLILPRLKRNMYRE